MVFSMFAYKPENQLSVSDAGDEPNAETGDIPKHVSTSTSDDTVDEDWTDIDIGLKVKPVNQSWTLYLRACRLLLAIVLVGFLVLPLYWLYWVFTMMSKPSTFFAVALRPGSIICALVNITNQLIILGSGIVQVLQVKSYQFVNKYYRLFNCTCTWYLVQSVVMWRLGYYLTSVLESMVGDLMLDEIQMWNRLLPSLDPRWDETQLQYSCCGFGEEADYDVAKMPSSCCPDTIAVCSEEFRFRLNCLTADADEIRPSLTLGFRLLWIPIPATIFLLIVFGCFKPFWTLARTGSQMSLHSWDTTSDLDDPHSDIKYIKVRSHVGTGDKKAISWTRYKWKEFARRVRAREGLRARMLYLKEKSLRDRNLIEDNIEAFKQLELDSTRGSRA